MLRSVVIIVFAVGTAALVFRAGYLDGYGQAPTKYVDVPGPVQYVDVPGPTKYIDIPGPVRYVTRIEKVRYCSASELNRAELARKP